MATNSTNSRPLLHRSSAITSTPPPSTTPEPQQPGNGDLLPSNEDQHPPSNQSDLSEIELFLSLTLSKNTKDRHLMLRIEADLNQFLKDESQSSLTFPSMSSYQRMLVHRIAGWYGLEHNLENSLVVVGRKEGAGAPRRGLRELERVQQEPPPHSWSHNQLTLPSLNSGATPRLLKVESFNAPSTRPQQQQFSKSYSFGGYSQGQGGQGQGHGQRYYYHGGAGHHQLYSRSSTNNTSLSPASSGYKSTSFEYCSTPPPIGSGAPPPPPQQFLCWAVTSLEQVPPGALVLDPNTGSPYYNQDGSVYYYDPGRLPGELQSSNIIGGGVLPSSSYPSTYQQPPPPHFLPVIQQQQHLQQQPQLIYLPAAAAVVPPPHFYNQLQQQQQQNLIGYYGNYSPMTIAPHQQQQQQQQHSCYGQPQPQQSQPSTISQVSTQPQQPSSSSSS